MWIKGTGSLVHPRWGGKEVPEEGEELPAEGAESSSSTASRGNTASAASMPLFMAVCVPLILGTFMKPGLQPIRMPPGKVSSGMDCRGQRSQGHPGQTTSLTPDANPHLS